MKSEKKMVDEDDMKDGNNYWLECFREEKEKRIWEG